MGGYRQILFTSASLLTFALSGCVDDTAGSSDTAGEATAFSERPASGRLVERDVEVPEVFQVTDKGLWDGRPSLGGVWVAYPDVPSPERVIIRNEGNGQYIIGALFKRERENPGPLLQVSSDAATALGMLAGSPTTLNVTALRREEPAAPAKPAVAADTPAADAKSTEAMVAGAAAAIDSAASDGAEDVQDAATEAAPEKKGWNPFRRKSAKADSTVPGAVDAADAVASAEIVAETTSDVAVEAAADAGEAIETIPEKKRGWGPFRRKSAAAGSSVPGVVDAAEVTVSAGASADTVAVASAAAATGVGEAIETTGVPVDESVKPKKAKSGWGPFRRKPKESLTPAAVAGTTALATDAITSQSLDTAPQVSDAAAAPGTQPTTSKLDKPYVQIGIFSVEEHANNTASELRRNGVLPQVHKQESSGKTFWRVVAGPASSKVDRAALVEKVKGMGFKDAYPVRG